MTSYEGLTCEQAMCVPSGAQRMDAMCAACGRRWGNHTGAACNGGSGGVFRLAAEPASMTPTLDKLANTAEPKHPELTWAKPANTDRFPGFTATSDCAAEPLARGLHSPDLKATSLVVYPHLVFPQHGTAHKLG